MSSEPPGTLNTGSLPNLMRVLWAINRQWDQDFKWIDQQCRYLPLKPQRLSERINTVFELSDPEQSIRTCFELIVETLALVPSEIDVAAALANVQAALEHGPLTSPP